MKKFMFILGTVLLIKTTLFAQQNPNFTVGVPVNDTLLDFQYFSSQDCTPDYTTSFSINVDTTVTGLHFFIIVDSISGTLNIPPYGAIQVGDTIPIPATYHLLYMSYPGFIRLIIKVIGTPQIANETYSCGTITVIDGGANCHNMDIGNYYSTCTVNLGSSIKDEVSKNKTDILISQNNLYFTAYPINIKEAVIYNYLGQKIISKNTDFTNPINLEPMIQGVYFIQITKQDNSVEACKYFKN